MNRWVFKAALQGMIANLPASTTIHDRLEQYVTVRATRDRLRVDLEAGFEASARHLAYYRAQAGPDALPSICFEIGTGRLPVVPLGLYLCGAERVYSVDLRNQVRLDLFRLMLRLVNSWPVDDLRRLLPALRDDRLEAVRKLARTTLGRGTGIVPAADQLPNAVLSRLEIELLVGDPRHTSLASGSVDLILSTSAFEHFTPLRLGLILEECRRIIAPQGVMVHDINMGDHYARYDPGITPYNYLRYTRFQWGWFNNPLFFQNRLRASDYRALLAAASFHIVAEETTGEDPAALDSVPLAPEFQAYPREDLLPTETWLVATPGERAM